MSEEASVPRSVLEALAFEWEDRAAANEAVAERIHTPPADSNYARGLARAYRVAADRLRSAIEDTL